MSIERLEAKFREIGLDQSDCSILLAEINFTEDYRKLLSLIYMFGYSFDAHPDILKVCDRYIKAPVPGLTAVCMRVTIDYWGGWQSYIGALKRFLDISIYDEWYDEVVFSASYVNRNQKLPFPIEILERFEELLRHPRASDLGSLISVAQPR